MIYICLKLHVFLCVQVSYQMVEVKALSKAGTIKPMKRRKLWVLLKAPQPTNKEGSNKLTITINNFRNNKESTR